MLAKFSSQLQQQNLDALSTLNLSCSTISTFSASVISDGGDNFHHRASKPDHDALLSADSPVFELAAMPLPPALETCVVVSAPGTEGTAITTTATEWCGGAETHHETITGPSRQSGSVDICVHAGVQPEVCNQPLQRLHTP